MKTRCGESWKIYGIKNCNGLLVDKRHNSLEGARDLIDSANMSLIATGHKARQYVICTMEYKYVTEDDGTIISRDEFITAIERYPEVIQ